MNYAKAAAALAATVLSCVLAALTGDGSIDPTEWINVIIAGVGVVSVYVVPNVASGIAQYAKLAVSALTAVLVLAQSMISDGISGTEWIQLALAALGALGVVALPGPVTVAGRHVAADPFPGGATPAGSGSTSGEDR